LLKFSGMLGRLAVIPAVVGRKYWTGRF